MPRARALTVSLLAVLWLLPGLAAAAAGKVAALAGTLAAAKTDGRKAMLAVGSEVEPGDTLITQADSRATIRFADGGTVTLRPNSQFQVQAFVFRPAEPEKDNLVFALLKGGLRTVTGLLGQRSGEAYQMKAATATIGVRGTDYSLLQCAGGECADLRDGKGAPLADGLHLEVHEGRIAVANPAGSTEIGAGQSGYVQDAATPPQVLGDGFHDTEAPPPAGQCVAR